MEGFNDIEFDSCDDEDENEFHTRPAQTRLPARHSDEDDSSVDDTSLFVEKAWFESEFFAIGSNVECKFTVATKNTDVDTSTVDISPFLLFTWYRSVDSYKWDIIQRKVQREGGGVYSPHADDMGAYIRCEASIDDEKPVSTDPFVVYVSSFVRHDLLQVLEEGIRGFSLIQVDGDVRRDTRLILSRNWIKLLHANGKTGGEIKTVTQTRYTKDCGVTISKTDPTYLRICTPTGLYQFSVISSVVRDYIVLVYRFLSGMANEDICSKVLDKEVHKLWKSSELFKVEGNIKYTADPDVAAEKYFKSVDSDLRGHEWKKLGAEYFLQREVLRSVFV